MGYFKTLGIALDQLGMALCGGDEDCTISATTGHYSKEDGTKYWVILETIIDFTFYPVDGIGHCLQAYHKDPNEDYKEGFKVPLFIITFVFCVVLGLIFWSKHIIGKFFNLLGRN